MTPNLSHVGVRMTLAAKPFVPNSDAASVLQNAGWRCFVQRTDAGVNWIIKRGASVALLVQALAAPMVQQVTLPFGPDGAELASLLQSAGLVTVA